MKVLLLEDSVVDALMLERELDKAGISYDCRVVETAEAFEAALDESVWDVILSDYSMDGFTGMDALAITKQRELDVPFIVVSGAIGEETAVEAMRAGAHDYIMKDKLFRLGPAVEREVGDARIRSEARKAREALAESARNWTTTFDALDNPVMLLTADQRITQCNKATREMLGLSQAEIIGQRCCELVHGTSAPPEECPFIRSVITKERETMRWVVGDRVFDVATDPIFADGNTDELLGAIHILTDVTDFIRSEERFRLFFENEPSYCYMVSPEGKIIDINQAALRALGYEEEELLGKPINSLYAPESQQQFTANFKEWQKTGRLQNVEMKVLTKKGEKRTVLLNAGAITDADGNAVSSVSVHTDITELRETEDQLHQSQKMEGIGRLAGGIAHDFNNLMMVVTGFSEIMLSKLESNEEVTDELEQILNAGNRASSLTRQLLAFSRKQVLNPKVADVNEILADFQKMLERIIGEDVELVFVPGDRLEKVLVDRGQIEQVIMNLVVNARDAMPSGGRLTLETKNVDLDQSYAASHVAVTPGPHVMIAVTDSGSGMNEETRARLFEPFFTTKGSGKGTGLGLSTVYGIVKQSGGNIWVYSEPGVGSTFKIYLPATKNIGQAPRKSGELRTDPQGHETILMVEDDLSVREVVAAMLGQTGYRVLLAESATDAARICDSEKGNIDVLLTDVVLQGMSGRELAQTLLQTLPDLRILYMSGYTQNAVHRNGVLEPGIAFLEKPFTQTGLLSKIKEVIAGDIG